MDGNESCYIRAWLSFLLLAGTALDILLGHVVSYETKNPLRLRKRANKAAAIKAVKRGKKNHHKTIEKIRQRGYGGVLLTVITVTHSRQRSVWFAKLVPAWHTSRCRRHGLEARRELLTWCRSFLPPSPGQFWAWYFGCGVWKAGQNQNT